MAVSLGRLMGYVGLLGCMLGRAEAAASMHDYILQAPHRESLDKEVSADPPPPIVEGGCEKPENTLLLGGHTVLRNVRWRVKGRKPDGSEDRVGCGVAIPHRKDTGHFWFFDAENIELTCKALDGTGRNGNFWVFCGALTTVEWWLEAINNANPATRKQYYTAAGTRPVSFADTKALPAGANTAPVIVESVDCGKTFELARLGSFSVSFSVQDAQQDTLTASVKAVKGDIVILPTEWNGEPFSEDGLKVFPRWRGGLSGSGATLVTSFFTPNGPGEFIFGIEVDDQKTLIPTLCTVGVVVR